VKPKSAKAAVEPHTFQGKSKKHNLGEKKMKRAECVRKPDAIALRMALEREMTEDVENDCGKIGDSTMLKNQSWQPWATGGKGGINSNCRRKTYSWSANSTGACSMASGSRGKEGTKRAKKKLKIGWESHSPREGVGGRENMKKERSFYFTFKKKGSDDERSSHSKKGKSSAVRKKGDKEEVTTIRK